ncbi:hypothetical protein [Neptunicella sp. SCSIO 80796]|uniref:hypothetical protein n=1 Tax=Neptunicella plasticusilytica TaxID=3117012 RepID=UPI003A4E226F
MRFILIAANIIVPVIVGYLVTINNIAEGFDGWLFAALLALLFTVTEILIIVMRTKSDGERRSEKVIASIIDAYALDKEVYLSGRVSEAIKSISSNYRKLDINNSCVMKAIAEKSLKELEENIESISRGYTEFLKTRPFELSAMAVSFAQEYVYMVDISPFEDWKLEDADNYLDVTSEIIKSRRVKVTRVFAQPLTEILNNLDVLDDHFRRGINVMILKDSAKTSREIEDYIIIDNSVLKKSKYGPNGMVEGRIITSEEVKVREYKLKLEGLISSSLSFKKYRGKPEEIEKIGA